MPAPELEAGALAFDDVGRAQRLPLALRELEVRGAQARDAPLELLPLGGGEQLDLLDARGVQLGQEVRRSSVRSAASFSARSASARWRPQARSRIRASSARASG